MTKGMTAEEERRFNAEANRIARAAAGLDLPPPNVRVCYECSGGYHRDAIHDIERHCQCPCRVEGIGTTGTAFLIAWGIFWLYLALLVWTGRL
jgi:hypothetical protein